MLFEHARNPVLKDSGKKTIKNKTVQKHKLIIPDVTGTQNLGLEPVAIIIFDKEFLKQSFSGALLLFWRALHW